MIAPTAEHRVCSAALLAAFALPIAVPGRAAHAQGAAAPVEALRLDAERAIAVTLPSVPEALRVDHEPHVLEVGPLRWRWSADAPTTLGTDTLEPWWNELSADEEEPGALSSGSEGMDARGPLTSQTLEPLDVAWLPSADRPRARAPVPRRADDPQLAAVLADDLSLSPLAGAAPLVSWDLGRRMYLAGLGQRRRPEPDSLAFVLSAEAGVRLGDRAGFAFGYELFRASDAGDSSFSDTLDEGLFAQLRLSF